jgi:hypothetical protein
MEEDRDARQSSGRSPLDMLRVVEDESRLREFVRAKRREGVISDGHAEELCGIRERMCRAQGIWRDPDDHSDALHRLEDLTSQIAVHRQSFHVLKSTLLDLYPQLAEDVKNLLSADRLR